MNTNEYILLFRDNHWHKGLSAEEMQQVATKWMAWFEGLMAEGKAISGRPLLPEGKLVTGAGGKNIADGPFAESKEAVGGFFLLKVEGLDEAVAIAQQCPGLPYGIAIEVRPVAEMCPMLQEAKTSAQPEPALA